MNRTFDIVIAGAGVVGLTAAALLGKGERGRQFNIRMIDAGERPQFDGGDDIALRVSAISAGSYRLFASLGVWDRFVAERAGAFREMRVWDAAGRADGPDALHFTAAEFALPELGFIVENVILQEALLRGLDAIGVSPEFGKSINSLRRGSKSGIEVECTDGERVHADLLIGADGAGSLVRQFANIPLRSWRYPQTAFVSHLLPEKHHRECAWQRFLPDGPLALLPLHDGRVSVVWSTRPEQAQAALSASDAELGSMLTDASGSVLGKLTASGSRGSFPLQAQYALRYVAPGLALIGDSAHSVHPLAGQGANLGIADAQLLTEVLHRAVAKGEHPADIPILRRYERGRKGPNNTMLYFIDFLHRLFSSPAPPLGRLRSTGMRLFNASGLLRKRAVAAALGLHRL